MRKKEKKLPVQKNSKTVRVFHDEIEKIIKVTDEQNLAIRKIIQSNLYNKNTNNEKIHFNSLFDIDLVNI